LLCNIAFSQQFTAVRIIEKSKCHYGIMKVKLY